MLLPVVNALAQPESTENTEDKNNVVILFQVAPDPLIDYEQYQLFQSMDTLDFANNPLGYESKHSSSESPGFLPVFIPSEGGSLRIKEPENAEKGFLLIKDPLVPGQD